jgi:hypothetical protein
LEEPTGKHQTVNFAAIAFSVEQEGKTIEINPRAFQSKPQKKREQKH